MKPLIKQRDGDSPQGLQDLPGLERIDTPYLTSHGTDYEARKRGLFHETTLAPTSLQGLYTSGDLTPVKVVLNFGAGPDGRTWKAARMLRDITSLSTYVTLFHFCIYVGAGCWLYRENYFDSAAYEFMTGYGGLSPVRFFGDIDVTVKRGLRSKNVLFGGGITYDSFRVVQDLSHETHDSGNLTAPMASLNYIEHALRVDLPKPMTMVQFTHILSNVGPYGERLLETLYALIPAETDPSLYAYHVIPRNPETADKHLSDYPITIVTPTIWFAIVGVLHGPNTAAVDRGGHVMTIKTVDGGASWSQQYPLSLQYDLPAAPAPSFDSPPYNAIEYYDCRLNMSLTMISSHQEVLPLTPLIWLISYPYYGVGIDPDGGQPFPYEPLGYSGHSFKSRFLRTIDGGVTFSALTVPTLLEIMPTPLVDVKVQVVRNMVYLGKGVVLAKVKQGLGSWATPVGVNDPPDPYLVNFIRSTDYGLTWACVPKSGFPAAALYERHFGDLHVITKKVGTAAGEVVITLWGGDGFYLYATKDDGTTWKKLGKISAATEPFPMDETALKYVNLPDSGVTSNNYRVLEYAGTGAKPVPPRPEAEWRHDTSKPWVPEP